MSTLYKNTGVARATKLTIDRKVEGVSIDGYPKEYDLKAAYPSIGLFAITASDFRKMHESDYIARRDAIIGYAKSITGYTASLSEIASGSITTDITSCPITGYVEP